MGDGHEETALERFLLREDHEFPWTEALTRSRWQPRVWWSLQVVRVVLVVIVLVLIGWGIKALANRQEAAEASEVIALTAVLVTGVGAVFTVAANAWLGRNRLDHEERMQQVDLAEDRRREGLDAAVRAYTLAAEVKQKSDFRSIKRWADAGMQSMDSEADRAVHESKAALEMVRVLGWEEVRNPRRPSSIDRIGRR